MGQGAWRVACCGGRETFVGLKFNRIGNKKGQTDTKCIAQGP